MTSAALTDSRLANVASTAIHAAWLHFADRFRIVTRRARLRFEARDWDGMAADHVERLDLYARAAGETADTVREVLGERLQDRMVWAAMKAVYSGLIADRLDWELAETFFNSVTRRIFATVGVDPRIEFVTTDFDAPPPDLLEPVYRTYRDHGSTAALVCAILGDAAFESPFRALDEDCRLAAERIEDRLRRIGGLRSVERAEIVRSVFFRGKGAYLVGRLHSGSQVVPVVFALLHEGDGIVLDALLLTENQVSILFSFTRSYFHVDVPIPHPLVHFLSTLMPRKRRAELYIALGHNKHGKTELYRELRRHLAVSGDRFEATRGTRGLVMVVFTLPGFDVVFKVIRDRFGAPKQLTRDQVLDAYRFVFRHDRAGRLVDAQEYEHLEFERERFDPALLEELASSCARTVEVAGDTVTIHHAYVERRVTPLDVYLDEVEPEAAEEVMIDFGRAIKDMAASGIFPGDMLLKNFGVTRHGRVVFYDYDELTTLDAVTFRRLPEPSIEDALAPEPWLAVGPDDVFPEELETFLGVRGRVRERFLERHRDLFDPAAWRAWQDRVSAGELIEIFPYDRTACLRTGADR